MEENSKSVKRQIAFKVRIKDLLNGRYVKEEGWEPNYIITENGKRVSRINVIGTVVAKPNDPGINYENVILDDGSGRISVRTFRDDGTLTNAEIGDVVMIIGRPREYGNEKYILPEILKKIKNEKWIEVRKLELGKIGDLKKEVVETEEAVVEEVVAQEPVEEIPLSQKVRDLIKEKDAGNGVDTEEVIKVYGSGVEKTITILLTDGEIFEIKPGKLKVLE